MDLVQQELTLIRLRIAAYLPLGFVVGVGIWSFVWASKTWCDGMGPVITILVIAQNQKVLPHRGGHGAGFGQVV